jgi:hypothetical protein
MSVFGRLGYTFEHEANVAVQTYSSTVNTRMMLVPALLDPWHHEDIANDNVGGYFQNPVADLVQGISDAANTVITYSSVTSPDSTVNNTISIALNLSSKISTLYAPTYKYVTDRQSNVVPIGNDVDTVHYSTAIGYGKLLSYLTNQTDGIQNNAPILGHFTSILVKDALNDEFVEYTSCSNTFINSISNNVTSISQSDAQSFLDATQQLANTMSTFPINDINFHLNSRKVFNDFHALKSFRNLGQAETQLLVNYIGTPKLVSRLT